MKFNSLDELPENGSLVWVKLPGERPIVRLYQNDSFGLGDRDFEVNGWSYYQSQRLENPKPHYYNPLSTSRAGDHINQDVSGLFLNLAR